MASWYGTEVFSGAVSGVVSGAVAVLLLLQYSRVSRVVGWMMDVSGMFLSDPGMSLSGREGSWEHYIHCGTYILTTGPDFVISGSSGPRITGPGHRMAYLRRVRVRIYRISGHRELRGVRNH